MGAVVEAAGVDGSLEKVDEMPVEPSGEVAVGVEDGNFVGWNARSRGRERNASAPSSQ